MAAHIDSYLSVGHFLLGFIEILHTAVLLHIWAPIFYRRHCSTKGLKNKKATLSFVLRLNNSAIRCVNVTRNNAERKRA